MGGSFLPLIFGFVLVMVWFRFGYGLVMVWF